MQHFLRKNETKEVAKNNVLLLDFCLFVFKFIALFQTSLQSKAVKGDLLFFAIQTVTIIHTLQTSLA